MATALQLPETPQVAYFTKGQILGDGVTYTEDDDGMHIRGLKIFRTGLLTDSQGRSHDWIAEELDAAVENFYALREELPDIPVRVGHTRAPHDLGGYYEDVRRDGEFLKADVLITEPDVAAKVKRKTFRSRSLEIGAYPSAKHGLCWPVILGLAFVDIPAVPGLYESPVSGKQFTVITESGTMPDQKPPSSPNTPDLYAAYYAQGLADGAAAVTPPEFQCFGAVLSDPAKVQEHINTLETFQKESTENARKSFIKGLVDSKVLLATQREKFEALALNMTPEQFELFQQGYEGAAANPLLQHQGGGSHSGEKAGDEKPDPIKSRIEELEGIVRFHKQSGVSDKEISTYASYTELQQLKGNK